MCCRFPMQFGLLISSPAWPGLMAMEVPFGRSMGSVDAALGVAIAPSTVRLVVVEGDDAEGEIVAEDEFVLARREDSLPVGATEQVISAILGTREGAAESGYQLLSTGVTWTEPDDAVVIRDALAAHKVENVMLVSAFLAAAALAQNVGSAFGYGRIALLYVEPDTAALAVVDMADGSIFDVHRQALTGADTVGELTALVSKADVLAGKPAGLFVVGTGVDIVAIKPQLEAATSLPVSVPQQPERALARGAALASANAPLFCSSTAALAYAKDPDTGLIDPYRVAAGYFDVAETGDASRDWALAYSAVADDEVDAYTVAAGQNGFDSDAVPADKSRQRKLVLLVGGAAAVFVTGIGALALALAIVIRPMADVRPDPAHGVVSPPNAVPPPAHLPAPTPNAPPPSPPAPAREAPAQQPAPPVAPPQTRAPAAPATKPAPEPAAPQPQPDAPEPQPDAPEPQPAVPAPVPSAPPPVATQPPPNYNPQPPPIYNPQPPPIYGPPAPGPFWRPRLWRPWWQW